MGNLLLFAAILSITLTSFVIGMLRFDPAAAAVTAAELSASASQELAAQSEASPPAHVFPVDQYSIPNIGSIQVLNGCGMEGAANRMADFLQSRKFDVKDRGNAATFNYPATMVISRTADMTLANEIEKILKTGHVVFIRTNEQLYDVTVIVGPNYEDKIK